MKKFFAIFFLSFLIISCAKKEIINEENLEEINSGITKNQEQNIQEEIDFKEVTTNEMMFEIYSPNATDNLKQKISDLKNDENQENQLKATYLESFIGDYENALTDREKLCKENPENTQYCKKVNVTLNSLIPKDDNGYILENVKVEFDGRKIDKTGKIADLESNFYHRIKYSKQGYLPYFININAVDKDEYFSFKPILIKATEERKINSNESTRISTKKFDIIVDKNVYYKENGEKYNGEVNLYFFELEKDDNDASVFNLDAFDSDGTLLGNSMITFGMPYMTAYDQEGNELEITEFSGRGVIQNQKDAPNMDLKNVPKGVYLNRDQLMEYNIPPFWYLQKNGTWITGKMKILDEKGNYEFIYND